MIAGILRNPRGRLRGDMTLHDTCASVLQTTMANLIHHNQHWRGNYETCGCVEHAGDRRRRLPIGKPLELVSLLGNSDPVAAEDPKASARYNWTSERERDRIAVP